MDDRLIDMVELTDGDSRTTSTLLMEELESRFCNDQIYSSIGTILLAVNPLKPLEDLYSEDARHSCMQSGEDDLGDEPHVWTVAQRASTQLKKTGIPQAIVITGESGGM